VISFTAYGIPTTQGSSRAFVRGKRAVVVHDKKPELMSWRSVIAAEAAKAMAGRAPIDAPVSITATFYLPRPESAPRRRTLPDRKPDLDKLARALGDSVEGICYATDSRIVEWHLAKRYGAPARVEVVVELAVGVRHEVRLRSAGNMLDVSLGSDQWLRMSIDGDLLRFLRHWSSLPGAIAGTDCVGG
jgi:Holliday junction resolvase RusA-like endonuclease